MKIFDCRSVSNTTGPNVYFIWNSVIKITKILIFNLKISASTMKAEEYTCLNIMNTDKNTTLNNPDYKDNLSQNFR